MSRILIVENSPSVALTEAYLLGSAGFDVFMASTAGEALSFVERAETDLIVLEYELPDMNGLALLETLRERGVRVPAVMVAGRADSQLAVKARQNGVCDYLVKAPDTAASLEVAVRRALGLGERAEPAVEALLARLHAAELRNVLLDACPDAAVLYDEDGTLLAVNAAARRQLGVDVGQRGDLELLGFTPQVEVPRGQSPLARLRKRGGAVSFEVERLGRTLACTVLPVTQAEGAPFRAAMTCKDVTRTQRSRRRLERGKARLARELKHSRAQHDVHTHHGANLQLLGTVTSGVAHELSNLLMPALGFADLLHRQLGARHPERTTVERVQHALQMARALVVNVLAMSRPGGQQPVPVDLGDLVADLLPLLGASTADNVHIHTQVEADRAVILGDPVNLRSLLLNLCINACHAMPTGGDLFLAVDRTAIERPARARRKHAATAPHARLVVRDTGTGVPPEIRERIFEPFFTTKAPDQGTGLGLHLVKGVVEAHGGTITMDSEVGRGTVFTVLLPAIAEPS